MAEGNSLVWVVQTGGAHRIDSQSHSISIADRFSLDFHDAWPLQIFIAERRYSPTPGVRRLSNIINVNSSNICAESPLKP